MNRHIPLVDTSRIMEDERLAIEREIAKVHQMGLYVGGPAVTQFEEQFAEYHGNGFMCVGVGNGEDALTISLKALDLKPAGEVLVPANDGGFAALACQNAGLTPVPVDVHEESGLVNASTLQESLTSSAVAVVATHLHGSMVDMPMVRKFCNDNALALVEDCSQAHGAELGAVKSGTTGDVAAYSHYPTKNLGAFGDGGSVVTNDASLAKKIRHLSNYGWDHKYSIGHHGGQNTRLDSLQAGVLKAKLPFLDRNNDLRAQILQTYISKIQDGRFLQTNEGVSVAHHAVLISAHRPQIIKALDAAQIAWDIHYPYLIQQMQGLKINRDIRTPVSFSLTREQISLPCFPTLEAEEIDLIVSVANGALNR